MKRNFAGAAFALAAGLLAVGVADGGPSQKPGASPKPDPMNGTGLAASANFTATLPDPKHPGKLLWKLRGRTGQFLTGAGKANAQDVTALLYKAGRQDATMAAPQADYNTNTKVIVASGGAVYTSLSQPGSWMRAPVVQWNADTGRGKAYGGVLVHNGGKNGGMLRTPVAYFDSGMKTVQNYPLDGGR